MAKPAPTIIEIDGRHVGLGKRRLGTLVTKAECAARENGKSVGWNFRCVLREHLRSEAA